MLKLPLSTSSLPGGLIIQLKCAQSLKLLVEYTSSLSDTNLIFGYPLQLFSSAPTVLPLKPFISTLFSGHQYNLNTDILNLRLFFPDLLIILPVLLSLMHPNHPECYQEISVCKASCYLFNKFLQIGGIQSLSADRLNGVTHLSVQKYSPTLSCM